MQYIIKICSCEALLHDVCSRLFGTCLSMFLIEFVHEEQISALVSSLRCLMHSCVTNYLTTQLIYMTTLHVSCVLKSLLKFSDTLKSINLNNWTFLLESVQRSWQNLYVDFVPCQQWFVLYYIQNIKVITLGWIARKESMIKHCGFTYKTIACKILDLGKDKRENNEAYLSNCVSFFVITTRWGYSLFCSSSWSKYWDWCYNPIFIKYTALLLLDSHQCLKFPNLSDGTIYVCMYV